MNGEKVEIYPNPTESQLNIKNIDLTQVKSMRVLNMLGQSVIEPASPLQTISLSELNNGMYVLQLELKNGQRFAESFIKK